VCQFKPASLNLQYIYTVNFFNMLCEPLYINIVENFLGSNNYYHNIISIKVPCKTDQSHAPLHFFVAHRDTALRARFHKGVVRELLT